jgi:hypothetical protein
MPLDNSEWKKLCTFVWATTWSCCVRSILRVRFFLNPGNDWAQICVSIPKLWTGSRHTLGRLAPLSFRESPVALFSFHQDCFVWWLRQVLEWKRRCQKVLWSRGNSTFGSVLLQGDSRTSDWDTTTSFNTKLPQYRQVHLHVHFPFVRVISDCVGEIWEEKIGEKESRANQKLECGILRICRLSMDKLLNTNPHSYLCINSSLHLSRSTEAI